MNRFQSGLGCALSILLMGGLVACSEQSGQAKQSQQKESAEAPANPTQRTIEQGALTGVVQENGSHAWRGIPYAAPPVGERRWQLPQPPQPWDGVYQADQPIGPCPQFASVLTEGVEDPDGDGVVGSEDCLYLSVYAPADAEPGDELPVMYWIYGGGNNSGYAGDYNGGNLAQSRDVIVVAINYRLGTLGWFLHPAIIDDDAIGAAASGNWSTMDTIHGLQWVQNNISAFGGDPENVTIFGESAGAGNVMSLVISPLAEGLFHRAIVESGGVRTTLVHRGVNYTDEEPAGHFHSSKEIVNKILMRDGKAANREEAKVMQMNMTDAEIEELLYQQDAAAFLKLYNPEGARNYPAPKKFTDGTVFLETPPMEQLAAGNHNHVPIILGTNRDERRIYMYRDPKWEKVLAEDPAEYKRVAKYPSDAWKLRGVDSIARAMSQSQEEPVYAYRFDWDEQATYEGKDLSQAIGAGHATEIAFVFNNWDVGFVPKEILYDPATNEGRDQLSNSMTSYWTNFAYRGKPGKGRNGEQVKWQPWQNGEGKPKMIILDSPNDGGIHMSSETVTAQSIKEEFMADEFSNQENLCMTYLQTFSRMGTFEQEEYEALGCEDK